MNTGTPKIEFLSLSAIGPHKPETLNALAMAAAKCDCNIENSYMAVLGKTITINMLLTGNWSTIAKMENALKLLEQDYGLFIRAVRTHLAETSEELLPYAVVITGLDHPGILYDITLFFARMNIYVDELRSGTHTSHLTDTPIFSLTLRIGIPADTSIADFREQFSILCDDLNLDGTIEPEK